MEPRAGTQGNTATATHAPDSAPGQRAPGVGRCTQSAERGLCRQTPKLGAGCVNCARPDLCGGCPAMGIPTAIPDPPGTAAGVNRRWRTFCARNGLGHASSAGTITWNPGLDAVWVPRIDRVADLSEAEGRFDLASDYAGRPASQDPNLFSDDVPAIPCLAQTAPGKRDCGASLSAGAPAETYAIGAWGDAISQTGQREENGVVWTGSRRLPATVSGRFRVLQSARRTAS